MPVKNKFIRSISDISNGEFEGISMIMILHLCHMDS